MLLFIISLIIQGLYPNNHFHKDKTRQNKLFDNDFTEEDGEIKEITNLVLDPDIKKCVGPLLLHANNDDERKLSRIFVLGLIRCCTGKKNKNDLEDIYKRMRDYEIFKGCEQGYSVIVRRPREIKNYLINIIKK